MKEQGIDGAGVRAQLERVLTSEQFGSARRLSGFLRFVVDSALKGSEVKESLIGVEVYGRDATYNPKSDSIVRAEASRLRAKLHEYYEGPGKLDALVIDVPKGSYAPVFQLRASPVPVRRAVPVRLLVAVAAMVAVVGAGWAISRFAVRPTIAVMPIRNLGQDRRVGPLADTVTSHLTQALLASGSWNVAGQAPSVDLIGDTPMLSRLNADAVLTGSVRALNNRDVRLTLELVNVADGYLMWRESNDWPLRQVAESQSISAQAAVAALTQKYTGRAASSQYRTYAQAREFWSTFTPAGLERSIPLFQKVIEIDPNFAPAWAGLADVNVRLADDASQIDTRDKVEAARRAAVKAIALDDSNAEAHGALGRIYLYKDWNFRGAVEQFQRAVALDPTRMNPATAYSQALTITRDMDGALGAIRDAQARLPVLPELLMQEGSVFFLAHRFEKMEAVGRELLTVDPEHTSGHWLVGLSLELRGRVREAVGEYETAIRASARDDTRVLCALSHAYGMAGDRKKAMETLQRILPDLKAPPTRFTLAYCAALTFASLDQREAAFTWLETARLMRDTSFPFFPSDARFDGLKTDERYARLAASIK